ncbi:MAG: hypothetical protein Fur006_25750 [Coleofasciculaceae cyanobacterium]
MDKSFAHLAYYGKPGAVGITYSHGYTPLSLGKARGLYADVHFYQPWSIVYQPWNVVYQPWNVVYQPWNINKQCFNVT